MSSEEDTTNIPYQLYYLGKNKCLDMYRRAGTYKLYVSEHDFSPETARRYHLQAILQAHGVDVKKSMRKQELIALFREHVQKNRDAILAEYWEKERLKSRKEEERAQSEEPKRGHRIRRRTRTPEDEHKTPRLLKSVSSHFCQRHQCRIKLILGTSRMKRKLQALSLTLQKMTLK